MSKGPVMERPENSNESSFTVSFRILAFYDVQTDLTITRFDTLCHGKRTEKGYADSGNQYNKAIYSSSPGKGLLITPKSGSESMWCISINTTPKALCEALREIANSIEAEYKHEAWENE